MEDWMLFATYMFDSVRQPKDNIRFKEGAILDIAEVPDCDPVRIVFSRKHWFSLFHCQRQDTGYNISKIKRNSELSFIMKQNGVLNFCRRVVKQNKNAGHFLNGIVFDLYIVDGNAYIEDLIYSYKCACRNISQKELWALVSSIRPYGETNIKKVIDIASSICFKNEFDLCGFVKNVFVQKSAYSDKEVSRICICDVSCTKKIYINNNFRM